MTDLLRKYSAWLFIIFIIASATYMGWIIHPMAEDINAYGSNPQLLSPLGLPTPPFSTLVDNAVDSFLHDNGRFVNYSDILLTALCPRWIWAVANVIFLAGLFLLTFRLVSVSSTPGSRRHTPQAIVALGGILYLICVPWHNFLFLQRYTTPYIWGSVLMLATAYGSLRIVNGHRYGRLAYLLLCVCAFLCGGWHEGISLTLACGLAPLWIAAPKGARRHLTAPLLSLAAGILLNVFAPGQFARADSVGIVLNPFNWFQPATLTGGIWPWPHIVPISAYIILASLILVCHRAKAAQIIKSICKGLKDGRRPTLAPLLTLNVMCICGAAATLGLLLFFNAPRVAVPGEVFAIVGTLSIAAHYHKRLTGKTIRRAIGGILVLSAILSIVNICTEISAQLWLSRDHRNIEAALSSSSDGQVFYDPVQWPHSNHFPWQWTVNHYYVDYVPLHFILVHPSNRHHRPLRLIPTSLKSLPSSIEVNGITSIGGDIISDREPQYTTSQPGLERTEIFPGEYPFLKINAIVETASGHEAIRFFEVIPFTTSKGTAHQRDLYYFRPIWRSWSDIEDPAVRVLSVSPAKYW